MWDFIKTKTKKKIFPKELASKLMSWEKKIFRYLNIKITSSEKLTLSVNYSGKKSLLMDKDETKLAKALGWICLK